MSPESIDQEIAELLQEAAASLDRTLGHFKAFSDLERQEKRKTIVTAQNLRLERRYDINLHTGPQSPTRGPWHNGK